MFRNNIVSISKKNICLFLFDYYILFSVTIYQKITGYRHTYTYSFYIEIAIWRHRFDNNG